jgi:thioredoxin-dependent peroxiredoxin
MKKEGEKAPEIIGIDQFGNKVSTNDFKGKKLVLYFYPKDDTPGCTAEACNLRDNYELLKNKGFSILGVSADGEAKHKKFAEKYNLPFQLLADTDKKVIEAFGAWGPKKFMGKEYEGILRSTFVIDENGVIQKVFDKVKTKDHTNQILSALED